MTQPARCMTQVLWRLQLSLLEHLCDDLYRFLTIWDAPELESAIGAADVCHNNGGLIVLQTPTDHVSLLTTTRSRCSISVYGIIGQQLRQGSKSSSLH